jgi:ATP/maltotriose-dependent transcriptional regulator MalT/DNA-binding SARP family transcriptional activator
MNPRNSSANTLVPRADLKQQLDAGLDRRLTLIVAPAGYGKTTLLMQWLQDVPPELPRVVYSIEENDNDPAHLLAGLHAAVCSSLPAGSLLPDVDENQESLSFPLSIIFHNAAGLTHSDWLLVLDDYHAIHNPAIHRALDSLLNKPDWPVHLLIASRVSPTLAAVARLRVEDQLIELDEHNLRFSSPEISSLFKNEGLYLDDPQLARVAGHTEGWPAALRLVCQASKRESGVKLEDLLDRMGDENAMFDYLAGQVLNGQPPEVRRFLYRTAVLPYLNAELCNACLDIANSSAILDNLRRGHLFITPIYAKKETLFRYHSLFAGFLRRYLEQGEGSEAVHAWQRRAAQYFMEHRADGNSERIANYQYAIQLWIDAGESASAADAIEVLAELLDWGQLYTLEKWFSGLPADEINRRPRLLIALGLLQEKKCLWSEALAALSQASHLLSSTDADRSLLVRVWVRQAWVYHRQGQYARSIELCQKAREALGVNAGGQDGSHAHENAEVYLILGENDYETGQMDEALRADGLAIQFFRECGDRIGEMRALSHQAYVYGNRGRLAEYIEVESTVLQNYTDLGSFRATSCLIGLADAYRQLGNYDLSWEMLDRSFRMVDANPDPLMRGYTLFLLGHWQRERGERAAARSSYEEARSIGDKLHEPTLLGEPRRGLALLALDEGDYREALRQAELALQQVRSAGYRALEGQTLITLGLIQEQFGNMAQAEAHFTESLQIYDALGDTFDQAYIYLYLADLYLRDGREADAFENFSRSLALSGKYGYDSLFTIRERTLALSLLIAALPASLQAGAAAEIARLLARIGEEAVEPLLILLNQEPQNTPLQECIIELLGKIGDVRSIPALDNLSRKHAVKDAALSALRQIAQNPAPRLHVYTLGKFQVLRGSQLIPPAAWQQRRKTKLLFLYLLAHRPRPIPRDELLDALWPDLSPDSAGLALNTTYSDLRKLLEPYLGKGMPSRYLKHEGECYGFIPECPTWYDVEVFTQAVQAGASSLHAVQELYRGDFLAEEPYLDWVVRERERLRSLYLNILMEMLDRQVRQGAWHEGVNLAHQILAQEPWLEEVWRAEMTCLSMQGRRSEAIQVYLSGERNLRQELGVEPCAETRTLYQQIKG